MKNRSIHRIRPILLPSLTGRGWGEGLLLLLFLLLSSCGPSGDDFRIRGQIDGMEQSDLYLYSLGNQDLMVDTIHVNEGRFVYAGHARGATPFILVFPNAVEQVIFANGGADLSYEAKASDLRNYVVRGTKENELLNDFRRDTRKANPLETRDRAEAYIREHTQSIACIYLFDRYFIQDDNADWKKTTELHDLLVAEHPENPYLLMVDKDIEDASKGQVGQTVNLPDSLATAPHLVLYFWASWQSTAWANMGELRRVMKLYDDKVARAVAISLDVTDIQWKNYHRVTDSLHIRQLYDGHSWNNPLARQLNIRRLPTYIILDAKKRIVSRFETPDLLEEEVKKAVKSR